MILEVRKKLSSVCHFTALLSVLGIFVTFSAIIFTPTSTYAKCSEPGCSAIESTGATADVCGRYACCNGPNYTTGWSYGAIFFTGGWTNESSWPTWNGSGSLDFTVRGAVYCCGSGGSKNATGISFDSGITTDKTTLNRSCGSSNGSWGSISDDYIKATVPGWALSGASCDSGNPATCTLTVNVSSTLSGGREATYNSYVKFYYQKTKYFNLAYDANGGSGAPGTQSGTTTDGSTSKAFTVSTGTPTRSGYTFLGWSTSSTATAASYWGGSSITIGEGTTTLYAVWQYAATFSGSVGTPASNGDSRIKSQNGANLLGDGSSTSFNIKAGYSVTRTNSNPGSTYSTYSTSGSSYPTSVGTSTGNLSNGQTHYPTTGTKTVTQSVGTSGSHCFYLTYENAINYVQSSRGGATWGYANACTTLYNPMYADFSGAIDVSPTRNLTGNASSGFRGTGYDVDGYQLTTYYKITRTDNTPTWGTSRYAVNNDASTSYNASKYPGSGSASSTTLAKTSSPTVYPITITFSVDRGTTKNKCFYLSFDNQVGYIGTNILTSPFDTRYFNGRTYRCVSIYNPNKWDATFSGSVSAANGSYLFDNGGDNKKGNGLRTQFTLTPTYTVTRTNWQPAWNVAPRYATNAPDQGAYSASNYPTSHTATFKALGLNASDSYTGSAKTVTVDIGGSATQCFYLSYNNTIVFIDETADKYYFDGRASHCYYFTNPAQNYTAHYGGTSDAYVNQDRDRKLSLTDSNRTGTLNNQVRNSGNNNNSDGRWVDSFPSYDQYTATFNHTITRTDDDKTSTADTTYYVNSTKVNWKVQYCEDAGCFVANYAGYKDYTSSKDANSGVRVSGNNSLTAKASTIVTTTPKFTLNAANKGTYIYQCQRLVFNSQVTYTSATDTSNRNGHKDNLTSESTYTATNPICVTLKNPTWTETVSSDSPLYHNIAVTGETVKTATPVGSRLLSGSTTAFETQRYFTTFYFDHILRRNDTGGFDESASGQSAFQEHYKSLFGLTSIQNAFLQPSIYGDSNYSVKTYMHGYEWLDEIRNRRYTDPNPINPANGSVLVENYAVTLNATNKNNSDSWRSSSSAGRTSISFGASTNDSNLPATNTLTNIDRSDYVLYAGQTKTFRQSTYNSRAAWYVRYNRINRKEVYTSAFWTSQTGAQYFDRVEKLDSSPQTTSPVYSDSRSTGEYATFTVYRPYNYEITKIEPEGTYNDVSFLGENNNITFDLTVTHHDADYYYLTDLENPHVYVIGYAVPRSMSSSSVAAQGWTKGGVTGYSGNAYNDLCSTFFSGTSGCNILSGQPDNVPSYDGNTNYNHVYRDDSNTLTHTLRYRTGSITVPELQVGDKYCVSIAIQKYNSDKNTSISSPYFVSASICRNISKRPSFQAWGGSVLAGGGIDTSQTTRYSQIFGSWSDFAVIANGTNKKMASAATLARGAASSATLCNLSLITIANDKCGSNATGSAQVNSRLDLINSIESHLIGNVSSIDQIPSIVANGTYILRTNSTVLINHDIALNASSSDDSVPAVVIIAPNISITSNVTRLDAWLVATGNNSSGGTVKTCVDTAGNDIPLSNSACTNPLVIHGSVLAGKVELSRTAGGDPINPPYSGAASYGGQPADTSVSGAAEVIDYSPGLLFWSYNQSHTTDTPTMVYVREMPARY